VEMEGVQGDYFLLPRAALQVDDEVWVVEDGSVRIVPVDVIQRRGSDIFVLGDLAEGDAVVTSGIEVATNGMQVEVSTESGETR